MDIEQLQANVKLGVRPSNKGLWISIALGAVAAFANLIFVSNVQGSKVSVLKAKTRLSAGKKVHSADFSRVVIYGDDLKEMKALVVEERDFDALAQAPLAETLEPGQILLQSSFGFSGNRGFRDAIGPEQRAIAIQVKEESSAVAYFVRPGDVVDVWAKNPDGMQNIIPSALVKAVGDATVVASDGAGRQLQYRTVTVIVPKDKVGEILSKLDPSRSNITLALAGPPGTDNVLDFE